MYISCIQEKFKPHTILLLSTYLRIFSTRCFSLETEWQCCILICRCMQKHNDDTITTSGHISLEKYASHFIHNGWKGLRKVMCERWTKTATYWPPAPPAIAVSLFRSPGPLNRGTAGLGAQPLCWELVPSARSGTLTSSSEHQLPDFLYHPEVYHCSTPTQFNLSTAKATRWSLRADAPVIYTGAFLLLTAWPVRRSICNNSKYPQVSRFLLSILADINDAESEWFLIIFLFTSHPVFLPVFCELPQGHQPQLVSPSSPCSIIF